MAAPGFGYSAGDFIATIQLLAKIIAAFKDSEGAPAEYQQIIQELETLNQVLQHLDKIQSTEINFAHINAIKCIALNCQIPLQEFLDKVTRRYGPSLDRRAQKRANGIYGAASAVGRKVQWVLVMEKDISKLRAMVGANLGAIMLLLSISHLEATSLIERLAKKDHCQQAELINGVKTNLENLTTITRANTDRLCVIEGRSRRDSDNLRFILEFLRSLMISLQKVCPIIFQVLYNFILGQLHLYGLILSFQNTISQSLIPSLLDNIHFEDVLGRTRCLPYQSFRYWKVFTSFLECEFRNFPGEQNVRRGNYFITDGRFEKQLIGEKEWGRKVFPGTRLKMSVIVETPIRQRKELCPIPGCPGKGTSCRKSLFSVCSHCGLNYADMERPTKSRMSDLKCCSGILWESLDSNRENFGPSRRVETHGGSVFRNNNQRERDKSDELRQEMDEEQEGCELTSFKRVCIPLREVNSEKDSVGEAFGFLQDSLGRFGDDPQMKLEEEQVTALHQAVHLDNRFLVMALLKKGVVDISARDNNGRTALHQAAGNGYLKMTELLLVNGAAVSAPDQTGKTALHLAAHNGHRQVVALLVKYKADITARDKIGDMPLHQAAGEGHSEVVKFLLQMGAYACTALHKAAYNGHRHVVELLLEDSGNIALQDQYGRTALHAAAERGHVQVVKLLLERKASTSMQDHMGFTAFDQAILFRHEEVKLLLGSARR